MMSRSRTLDAKESWVFTLSGFPGDGLSSFHAPADTFQVLSQLEDCHEVVFVVCWIMTGYVTTKVSKHGEHPQILCAESLQVMMIPGQIIPRDAAEINFLEQTCPIISNNSANPAIYIFPSAYSVWDYTDLRHRDEALTSRAATLTDSKTNMRLILPEC